MTVPFIRDDGGRSAIGFALTDQDCASRAIAVATGRSYFQTHVALLRRGYSLDEYIVDELGWVPIHYTQDEIDREDAQWAAAGFPEWSSAPVMAHENEQPLFNWRGLAEQWCLPPCFIACTGRHVVAVLDGAIHDIDDPARWGPGDVYQMWMPPT